MSSNIHTSIRTHFCTDCAHLYEGIDENSAIYYKCKKKYSWSIYAPYLPNKCDDFEDWKSYQRNENLNKLGI